MTKAKIAIGDIETAPLISGHWGLFDQNISLNQIETEWAILSFSWKPLGGTKKDIVYMDTKDQASPRDDLELCTALWHLLDEYDFLIAQNGKRFDLKKINARLIMHGFKPPSPIRVIDTLLMARQVAAFTSNKLEWLSSNLTDTPKSHHNKFPGWMLWKECLDGNPKAWAEMRKYNIRDIDATEKVYLKLRPWVKDHPNVNVYEDTETINCRACGSDNQVKKGFSYTNIGKYQRYHCGDCGSWHRGRQMLNTTASRKLLTA